LREEIVEKREIRTLRTVKPESGGGENEIFLEDARCDDTRQWNNKGAEKV
jgi:hypothetical protein